MERLLGRGGLPQKGKQETEGMPKRKRIRENFSYHLSHRSERRALRRYSRKKGVPVELEEGGGVIIDFANL